MEQPDRTTITCWLTPEEKRQFKLAIMRAGTYTSTSDALRDLIRQYIRENTQPTPQEVQ